MVCVKAEHLFAAIGQCADRIQADAVAGSCTDRALLVAQTLLNIDLVALQIIS